MLGIFDPVASRVDRGALRGDPEALRVDISCARPIYLGYP